MICAGRLNIVMDVWNDVRCRVRSNELLRRVCGTPERTRARHHFGNCRRTTEGRVNIELPGGQSCLVYIWNASVGQLPKCGTIRLPFLPISQAK